MRDTFLIDKECQSVKVAGETQFYLYKHKKEVEEKKNSLSRMGLWVDHDFSWLHHKEWQQVNSSEDFFSNTITNSYHHPFLSLSANIQEVVHPNQPFYMRKIELQNHFNIRRNIRLFFYQNISPTYHIGGDTAFFAPKEQVFYHFRKKSCWLFNGSLEGQGIRQYTAFSQMRSKALEKHCFNEKEGELFFNPIAKGYVTSVFSLEAEIQPFETINAYYWIAADKNKQTVLDRNERVLTYSPETVFHSFLDSDTKVNV